MAIALVIALNFSVFGAMQASAHNTMLGVDYDNCVPTVDGDGIDEARYILERNSECRPAKRRYIQIDLHHL